MNPFIIYSLVSLSKAQIINRADWPEGFKVPPINQAWVDRILRNANIPNSPPRGPSGPFVKAPSDIDACNDQNTWAFSYDDGPGPYTVENALVPLRNRNIKATFYVTGQQVVLYPEILKQIHDEGHSIGIHSWSHKGLSTLTNEEIISEIVWTASAIHRVIGLIPTHVRPPFMDLDDRSRAVIQAMGFKVSIWNFDSFDWQYQQPAPGTPNPKTAIGDRFRAKLLEPPKGTIALQHDLFILAAQEIAPTLEMVTGTSYKFATIPDCAAFPAYGNPLISEILGLPGGSSGTSGPGTSGPGIANPTTGPGTSPPQQSLGFNVGVYYGLPVAILLLLVNI